MFSTLVEAVFLVALVVLFFLQDWKAMILPMIDVPVSLVGTFAVLAVLGFSLNNLTLFGLVLAIGIVVDDAIVVLENIERLIGTGLDARTATIKAMDELTGPIVAITLVLSSVFIPSIFIPGLDGAVLPAVRRHDRHGGHHFGRQRAHVDALAGRFDLPHGGNRRAWRAQKRGPALVDFRRDRRGTLTFRSPRVAAGPPGWPMPGSDGTELAVGWA